MNSTNRVVANAMAATNAAPKGLTPTTKLRLKEDFTDEYGSYKKGSVFPMYAMGGINPRFGTMMVPGRGVTLQIPWEKLEVVNACARNDKDGYVPLIQSFNKLVEGYFEAERALDRVPDAKATVLKPLKDVYSAIRKAHEALKKWNG